MAAFYLSLSALAISLQFLVLLKFAAGRQYVVGGRQGWIMPASSSTSSNINYSSWALRHKYYVDDILVFNYPAEPNSVVEVNRQHFDACDATDPIASYGDGKTAVQLNKEGPHWFISAVSSGCNRGQKFGIMVFSRSASSSMPTIIHMAPPPEASPSASPAAAAGSPSQYPLHATAPTPTNGALSLRICFFTPLLLGFIAILSCWLL